MGINDILNLWRREITMNNENDINFIPEEQDGKRSEIEDKLIEIALRVINKDRVTDLIEVIKEDTLDNELNSINFIELIVGIETEFNIEFDDEYLEFGKLSSISAITDYILLKLSESELE
jgi:acyl carrier protein